MNDKKPLPRYAPRAKDDRTITPQFWECVALHFAEAHETNFTHGPIDYDNICGKCSFSVNCFGPDKTQLDWYWGTANAILFEKSGVSCKFIRDKPF